MFMNIIKRYKITYGCKILSAKQQQRRVVKIHIVKSSLSLISITSYTPWTSFTTNLLSGLCAVSHNQILQSSWLLHFNFFSFLFFPLSQLLSNDTWHLWYTEWITESSNESSSVAWKQKWMVNIISQSSIMI